MNTWQRQASRVYGNGQSYNCTNIATAKTLQNTLNSYETEIHILKHQITIQNNYEKINKQIIQLKLTINILADEITNLQRMIANETNTD